MSQADVTISTKNRLPSPYSKGADANGVSPEAQALYDKLWSLACNLWWSWHPECDQLFRDIDPIRWRQLDHNPIALLREFTPDRLSPRSTELVLHSRIN